MTPATAIVQVLFNYCSSTSCHRVNTKQGQGRSRYFRLVLPLTKHPNPAVQHLQSTLKLVPTYRLVPPHF